MQKVILLVFVFLLIFLFLELYFYFLTARFESKLQRNNLIIDNTNINTIQGVMNVLASKNNKLFSDGFITTKLNGTIKDILIVDKTLYLTLTNGNTDLHLTFMSKNIEIRQNNSISSIESVKKGDQAQIEITYNFKSDTTHTILTKE